MKDVAEIKQCALRVDKWIITTGGPVIDHILQEHPDDDSLNDSTAKLRPLTNSYGITPSLLISRGDFFERQLLQVSSFIQLEKLSVAIILCVNVAMLRLKISPQNLNTSGATLSHSRPYTDEKLVLNTFLPLLLVSERSATLFIVRR